MNFLSHFYFDRHTTDSYQIIGTVLPDLVKNADKSIIIHPEKLGKHNNAAVNSIIQGWKKHLEVDKYFHSSAFFAHHSHQLKLALKPAIEQSPVKPFFLGHIALELILDNILITTEKINVDDFYTHLDITDSEIIHTFLTHSNLTDTDTFFKFFTNFKKNRYLHTYAEADKIAYALKRICMRIWKDPFTASQEENITEVLLTYRHQLITGHMLIFDKIEAHLG